MSDNILSIIILLMTGCAVIVSWLRWFRRIQDTRFNFFLGVISLLAIAGYQLSYLWDFKILPYFQPYALKGMIGFILIGAALWLLNPLQKKIRQIAFKLALVGYLIGLLPGWIYPGLLTMACLIAVKVLYLHKSDLMLFRQRILIIFSIALVWELSEWHGLYYLHFLCYISFLVATFKLFDLILLKENFPHEKASS